MSSTEIRVVAIVDARPGDEPAVADIIQACVAPTRQEAGCRSYAAHRDTQNPTRFVFIERWDSHASLDAHMRTPHLQAMAAALKPLVARPLEVLVLEELV